MDFDVGSQEIQLSAVGNETGQLLCASDLDLPSLAWKTGHLLTSLSLDRCEADLEMFHDPQNSRYQLEPKRWLW